MNISEMNLIAGNYDIQCKRVPGHGIYLLDRKSSRYRQLCPETDVKFVTKEKLLQEIRSFTAFLHNRFSS